MTDIITEATEAVEAALEAPADKPKRKRRTKAEIEAANLVAGTLTSTGYDVELAAVGGALQHQDEKWGEQNHPLIGGLPERVRILFRNYKAKEVEYQAINRGRVLGDTMGWDSILLEEVFEALSEGDPDKAYDELIQVAAVAINAANSIKRNGVSK